MSAWNRRPIVSVAGPVKDSPALQARKEFQKAEKLLGTPDKKETPYGCFTNEYVSLFKEWIKKDEAWLQDNWKIEKKYDLSSLYSKEMADSKPGFREEIKAIGERPRRPFWKKDDDPRSLFVEDERSIYWLQQVIRKELNYRYDRSVLGEK